MKVIRLIVVAFTLAGLTACGGGGDGTGIDPSTVDTGSKGTETEESTPGTTPDNPAGPMTADLTLSSSDQEFTLTQGERATVSLQGSVTVTPAPEITYLEVRDLGGVLAAGSSKSMAAGGSFDFNISFTSPESLAPGTHTGTIRVNVCEDAQCSSTVSGAEVSLDYSISMISGVDWETHQGSAFHRGYAPFTLDPVNFTEAWTWSATAPDPQLPINAVTTEGGRVFVIQDVYNEDNAILFALDEENGAEQWRVEFGAIPALNPPAVSDGQVYVSTSGHEDTFLYAFDAEDGSQIFKVGYEGQWPYHMPPTVYQEKVYHAGGYYGGLVHARRTQDGVQDWEFDAGGVWDRYTPAVDDERVYHHNGETLFMLNRIDGSTYAAITDPAGDTTTDYHGSPVVGSRDNVLAFVGSAFSGAASSQKEHYDERVISSYSIPNQSIEWTTSYAYLTHFALADGVLYAARNDSMSLDAIDEATGQVLWSWTPGAAEDTSFHRNVVVTDNLLFVSTNTNLYALDLDTREPVWSYPEPGMIAVSAYGTLFIATGAEESDGGLVAIHLL